MRFGRNTQLLCHNSEAIALNNGWQLNFPYTYSLSQHSSCYNWNYGSCDLKIVLFWYQSFHQILEDDCRICSHSAIRALVKSNTDVGLTCSRCFSSSQRSWVELLSGLCAGHKSLSYCRYIYICAYIGQLKYCTSEMKKNSILQEQCCHFIAH